MVTRLLIVIAVGSLASGCEKRSALYCERNPSDLANCEQTDAATPQLVACMMDNQCTPPHCELGANVCVECLDNSHCPPGEFCDIGGSFSCRGCIADTDCPGAVCLPGGSCGGDSTVIHVGEGGADNPTCGIATPCATVTHALTLLTMTRNVIKVSGQLTENVLIKGIDVDIDIVGGSNAQLTLPAGGGIGIKVEGVIVRIYDLRIVCTGDQDGVVTAAGSTLTLDGVDVSGCDHDAGVDLHGGYTIITRSEIHANPAGGIRTDAAAKFTITNNFIHHNGALGGAFGGVKTDADLTDRRFDFNTVVANQVSGVDCKNTLVTPNNIIGGNGTVLSNNVVLCDATGSLVTDNLLPLAFVKTDAPPYDYHIGETSTAKDNVTIQSSLADDIDRDLRPQDVAMDFGADEYRAPMP